MLTLAPRMTGAKQSSLGELPSINGMKHGRRARLRAGGGLPEAPAEAGRAANKADKEGARFFADAKGRRDGRVDREEEMERQKEECRRWVKTRVDVNDLIVFHSLSARVVQAGLESGNLEPARRLYERIVCVPDLLPALASHGLIFEISFPRALMREVQAKEAPTAPTAAGMMAVRGMQVDTVEVVEAVEAVEAKVKVAEATVAPMAHAAERERGPTETSVLDVISRAGQDAALLAELQALVLHDRAGLRLRLQQLGVTTLGARLQAQQLLLARAESAS